MTDAQFYEFCRTNSNLRIERNASRKIIVMPPAFSDVGNRNLKVPHRRRFVDALGGLGDR
jgi:hypothetical protein